MNCISKKYLGPVKIIKFSVLFICGFFTLTQVSKCVNKLFHPPVSTHYFYLLNDTIRYPSVTICRHPAYKTWLYPKYGLLENTELNFDLAFENFKFANYTLEEFMAEITYNFREIFRNYAYAGIGSHKVADNQEDSFLKRVMLEYAENMEVLLDVSEYRKLTTTNYPCISDENFSKSKCIEMCVHLQIASKANCTAPWLILPEGHNFSLCNNYISIRELIKDFRNSRSTYMQNCQCSTACNINIYYPTIIKRKEEFMNAPESSIQMYFGSNLVSVMDEKAGYDWIAFVADLGGLFGFLLGLSVLSLMCLIEQICIIVIQQVIQKLIKKDMMDEELDYSSNNASQYTVDDEGRNNAQKVEETKEPKVVQEHKHIKDVIPHNHVTHSNIFSDDGTKRRVKDF